MYFLWLNNLISSSWQPKNVFLVLQNFRFFHASQKIIFDFLIKDLLILPKTNKRWVWTFIQGNKRLFYDYLYMQKIELDLSECEYSYSRGTEEHNVRKNRMTYILPGKLESSFYRSEMLFEILYIVYTSTSFFK